MSTASAPIGETSPPTSPPISPPGTPKSLPVSDANDSVPPLPRHDDDEFPPEDHSKHYAKTLRLTSDQLVSRLSCLTLTDPDSLRLQKTLKLKKGMNTISFSVRSSYSGIATCSSRVFLWESDFQVVISDIDGTITKYVFLAF